MGRRCGRGLALTPVEHKSARSIKLGSRALCFSAAFLPQLTTACFAAAAPITASPAAGEHTRSPAAFLFASDADVNEGAGAGVPEFVPVATFAPSGAPQVHVRIRARLHSSVSWGFSVFARNSGTFGQKAPNSEGARRSTRPLRPARPSELAKMQLFTSKNPCKRRFAGPLSRRC